MEGGKRVASLYGELGIKDTFTPGLEKAKRGAKDFGRSMQDSEKSVRSFGDRLKQGQQQLFYLQQNLQAVGGAFGKVFATANEWAQVGLQAQKNQMALKALVGTTQEYEAQIRAVRDATRGATTEGEAAALAYQVQRFGMAKTSAEMKEFVRVAAIVGAASPQLGSTADAVGEISMTIANMSYARLDQLGISSGKVRSEVQKLKDEIAGMTTEAAFQQVVMQELADQANMLGDEMLELDDASARFMTRWRGFKEEVGAEIAEGFEGAATAVDAFFAAIEAGVSSSTFTAAGAKQAGQKGNWFEAALWLAATQVSTFYGGGQKPSDEIVLESIMQPASTFRRSFEESQLLELGWTPEQIAASGYQVSTPWANIASGPYGMFKGGRMTPRTWGNVSRDYSMALMQAYTGTDMTGWGRDDWYDHMMRQENERMMRGAGGGLGPTGPTPTGGGALGSMAGAAAANVESLLAMNDAMRTIFGTVQSGLPDLASAVFHTHQWSIYIDEVNSLAERFGTGAGQYQTEIYREMASALNEAGLSQEQYNSTLMAYEHLTGMANAQSAAFDEQMANLAERFAAGDMSQLEYLQALSDVSTVDLSNLNWLTTAFQADPATLDTYNEILGKLGDTDFAAIAANFPQDVMTLAQRGVQGIAGILFGGGAVEGSDIPVGGRDAVQSKLDELTSALETASDEWVVEAQDFRREGLGAVEEGLESVKGGFDHISQQMDQLDGRKIDVWVGLHTLYDQPAGPGEQHPNVPTRDSGGRGYPGQPYLIGTGRQPELFVPDSAGTFYPASQGSGTRIIHVVVDGQVIAQAVDREHARQNR